MNMIRKFEEGVGIADLFVVFGSDAELSAALADAAAGKGLPAETALVLAVSYIRRLEAAVRRLEAAQGPAAATAATGGQP